MLVLFNFRLVREGVADQVGFSDSVSGLIQLDLEHIHDNINLEDQIGSQATLYVNPTDSFACGDSQQTQITYTDVVGNSIGFSDGVVGLNVLVTHTQEALDLTDINITHNILTHRLLDIVGVSDATSGSTNQSDQRVSLLSLVDSQTSYVVSTEHPVTTLVMSDLNRVSKIYISNILDSVAFSSTISPSVVINVAVSASFGASDIVFVSLSIPTTFADSITLNEFISVSRVTRVAYSDFVSVVSQATFTPNYIATFLDTLVLDDAERVVVTYSTSAEDIVNIATSKLDIFVPIVRIQSGVVFADDIIFSSLYSTHASELLGFVDNTFTPIDFASHVFDSVTFSELIQFARVARTFSTLAAFSDIIQIRYIQPIDQKVGRTYVKSLSKSYSVHVLR